MVEIDLNRALRRQRQAHHYLLGVSTATGMNALSAMRAGADFIMVLNSGKFRQMGRSSLGGYLPFTNSNLQTRQLTLTEILPIVQDFPILVGVNATDPCMNSAELIEQLKAERIAGVVNYPTICLFDGQFREGLFEDGIRFEQEIDFLRHAHQQGLFTVAFVTTVTEALLANTIPPDVICIHLGLTEGGLRGARRIHSFEATINQVTEICQALKKGHCQSLLMIYGGIVTELTEVRYLYNRIPSIDGYIGGSTFERLTPEQTITNQTRAFKDAAKTTDDNLTVQILKGAAKFYTPVNFVKKYISENYSEPIYLAELADMLHLTPAYLSTKFKQQTEQSFTEYLIRFRLNKAVELFQTTTEPLTTIATLVGYPDYAQFNKIFRKYFGESPRAYRQHERI
ncbi:phosphoenolpyruvate hydrolase family protein [Lapidilactobacillus achengensis]|uniref:Phosphoenolpyruvate hydrolase family protein n=1 Tax=Lapidilactobacillus achengensis TaxID=2486000 RepID=A0ABW1URY7_9LACO|nr:phosphoenolpyruvate hydrolase family protein [Lapidilactobacillus achengensis]